jgi:hypothetical protein
VSHRARLDVPTTTVKAVTAWIARHRRRSGTRPWQRAASVHRQVVLVLRWLRHRADLRCLARDAGVSEATAYRYLHEGLDVIAARAPDLHEVLDRAREQKVAYLCLDGTLVPTDRVGARTPRGNDLFYSGRHRFHGGNIQVIADPGGFPLWVSDARPGSFHDLACARELVLPALYSYAATSRPDRLPVLADKGYTGWGHLPPAGDGIGVEVPTRRTRQRPPPALASPRARHPRPLAHRRHRRRPRADHHGARTLVRKPQWASGPRPASSSASASTSGPTSCRSW